MGNLRSRNSLIVEQPRYSADTLSTKAAIDPLTSNLYVYDIISRSVKVFASNFDFLFTFTDTSLKRPYGMCISHDKVFITDIFVCVILVFTLEGYIVSKYSFLTCKKRYLRISYPCGVAVDRNGDIYTCESYDSHSKILVLTHDEDMNYYFAHSSLNSPRDVSVNVKRKSKLEANTLTLREMISYTYRFEVSGSMAAFVLNVSAEYLGCSTIRLFLLRRFPITRIFFILTIIRRLHNVTYMSVRIY